MISRFSRYNHNTKYYDIAIMMLASPFEYTDYVRPACLPPAEFEFENGRMIVSGMVSNKKIVSKI